MEYGTIKPIEITQEMRSAYLDYAMSTIVARALPDVRDGLKPVQRRIIYVMDQLGLQHTAPYKKSARIVGDTLGRYHPHGDVAVYEAMVRLAQDFSMRYPLVDGQGNFGCFTADTKVKLLDGTDRTFAELAEMFGADKAFYVYSIDDSGNVVVAEGRNARVTRRNAEIMELELDNGETIRCTPDHRFMLRDGSYKQAQDLAQDDSLMPAPPAGAAHASLCDHRIVAKQICQERGDVYDITVEPHHNFLLSSGVFVHNSVDGDPPAAQRYTEARLAAIAEELLHDIEKQTVDFTPNFDGTLEEPLVLPAGLPNLLLNGAAGIAVGMATNIPPHNLAELCAALSLLIENPEVGVEELMAVMPGPDFPTGGIILGQEGIRTAYSTGKGHFVVRAKAHIEEATRGRYSIILTELPYQVNKARLLERIADLVKQERLNDISDLRDESDRTGMRVVITLKREAQAEIVLNQLFKFTQMQVTFGVNLLALVDGTQPRVMTLKRMLQHYITHRQEVIIRRTRHDLEKARNRAHILEGLLIALDFIDEVIDTIRRSQTAETAKVNLMRRFKLSEIQAQAILDLQLRRLAALERKKIEEEYQEIKKRIAELEAILANPRRVLDIIQADLAELRTRYGDARRTRITDEEAGEITAADLIPDVEVLVSVTERGFIRRLPLETYRRQSRGTRGQVRTREQDAVVHAVVANTKDDLVLFSDRGKCYQIKAHQLPDAERDPKGLALSNLISVDAQERVTGVVPVRDLESPEFIVLATRSGKVKRTELAEFRQVRSSGVVAMGLDKGDALVGARRAQGNEEIVIVSEAGQAIRFVQGDLRPMGRSAGGVRAIALGAKDRVMAMDLIRVPDDALLTIGGDGYGKRAPLAEYPVQGRGGKGVASTKPGQRLAAARVVGAKDEVTVITSKGVVVRLPAAGISQRGRATRGDRIVELDTGDAVVALGVMGGEEFAPAPPPPPEQPPAPARRKAAEPPEDEAPAPARRQAAAPAPKKNPARRQAAEPPAKRTPARRQAAEEPAPPAKKAPAAAARVKKATLPAAAEPEEPPRAAGRKAATPQQPPPAGPEARQMTLDEAVPPPPAEEERPPLIIRRGGRILGPEDEEQAAKPAAAPARGQGALLIRRLSQDPTLGPPPRRPTEPAEPDPKAAAPGPQGRRKAAPPVEPVPAGRQAAKAASAPPAGKKPAPAAAKKQASTAGKKPTAAPPAGKKPAAGRAPAPTAAGKKPAAAPPARKPSPTATGKKPAPAPAVKRPAAAPPTGKKPAPQREQKPTAGRAPAPTAAGKKPSAAPPTGKKPVPAAGKKPTPQREQKPTAGRAPAPPAAGKKPARKQPPTAAEKKPATRQAGSAATAGKKPAASKRTDVGISPVLSMPVAPRKKRTSDEEEESPRGRQPAAPGKKGR